MNLLLTVWMMPLGEREKKLTYLFVVKLEILSKLPPSSLLFPPGRTVMGQVGVGVIIKETRHCSLLLFISLVNPKGL